KTATGVRIDNPLNCPAFCYRIIVTNSGNVRLTSLVVSDDSVPNPDLDLSGCGFPTTLLVGESASCVIQGVTHCDNTVNVVTARGVSDSGQTVSSQDTNSVMVVPIAVQCSMEVSTDGGVTFVNLGTCAQQDVGQSYIVRIRVT